MSSRPSSAASYPVEPKNLVVGLPGQLLLITFDGNHFTIVGRYVDNCTIPNWFLFKRPDLLYGVNKLGEDINMFQLFPNLAASHPSPYSSVEINSSWTKFFFDKPKFVSGVKGSPGAINLAFNSDGTRIVEPCYDGSTIDIWDSSATDGSLELIKSLSIPGEPSAGRSYHRPCRAVLDPTGRFFVVPNFSGDTLLVVDAKDDLYEITDVVKLPVGVGARRAAFLENGSTSYLVVLASITN